MSSRVNNMKEINIEKIMEEIREEIKEKYGEEAASFEEVKKEAVERNVFDAREYREELYHANMNWELNYFAPLPGGIKGTFKKLIRKMGTFLGAPLVQRQNDYNAKVVRMFNQLSNYMDYQEERNKELERIIEGLEERITKIEKCGARK